ncbi:sulfatase-like hydrolase/transferase [Thalassotalea crassostreae]|uniref:sulfatase-like hydrolase/transferase n=1 Tax=Thalassotalea crassostreae TaxID=1763536 RepID=UPI000837F79C|nr:sulfatase-like hydrolase/transferase [Thalassotalea crassostreae]
MILRILAFAAMSLISSLALAEKTNIVFIFADDMSYKTAGFMGHDVVKTPNLDKLANDGVVFNRAYNMGAWTGAVCISSRTMLNSGFSVWRAHEVNNLFKTKKSKKNSEVIPALQQKKQTIMDNFWATRMEAAGYDTYISGKWHVSAPAKASFDEVGTIRPGMPKQTKQRYERTFDEINDSWSPFDKSMGGFWAGGQHWTEALADEAISFLNTKKQSYTPFFMYVSFNAPHDPRQAPKEFVDMYPLKDINLPASYQEQHPLMEHMGLLSPKAKKKKMLRDENLGPLPRTEYSTLVNRQEYYASITHLDSQIGRILAQLEANKQMQNTVIIFTADHGLAIGEHGLLGKQNLYEHSMRAPFFIAGKGMPKGQRRNAAIYLQDAMATSLDLAGAALDNVEFKSVLPLVADKQATSYSTIYGAYLNTQRAIIQDNYKLVLYPKAKSIELYDLVNDPNEVNNLAKKADMKIKIKSLFASLRQEQVLLGDKLKLEETYPELL